MEKHSLVIFQIEEIEKVCKEFFPTANPSISSVADSKMICVSLAGSIPVIDLAMIDAFAKRLCSWKGFNRIFRFVSLEYNLFVFRLENSFLIEPVVPLTKERADQLRYPTPSISENAKQLEPFPYDMPFHHVINKLLRETEIAFVGNCFPEFSQEEILQTIKNFIMSRLHIASFTRSNFPKYSSDNIEIMLPLPYFQGSVKIKISGELEKEYIKSLQGKDESLYSDRESEFCKGLKE